MAGTSPSSLYLTAARASSLAVIATPVTPASLRECSSPPARTVRSRASTVARLQICVDYPVNESVNCMSTGCDTVDSLALAEPVRPRAGSFTPAPSSTPSSPPRGIRTWSSSSATTPGRRAPTRARASTLRDVAYGEASANRDMLSQVLLSSWSKKKA